MLVLTRSINQSVIIGDNLVVKVLSIRGNQVRLGFEAPQDVSIYRDEIWERMNAAKAEEGAKDSAQKEQESTTSSAAEEGSAVATEE